MLGWALNLGFAATESDTVAVVAEATTGRPKRRYPRWVVINGERYRVNNADEERQLLRAMADRAADQQKIAIVLGDTEVAESAKKRAITIKARIKQVDTREADWLAHLIQEDEEIIAFLH